MTVEVTNCSFKECGDNGDKKAAFACACSLLQSQWRRHHDCEDRQRDLDTKGVNGDILLGDGRDGQGSQPMATSPSKRRTTRSWNCRRRNPAITPAMAGQVTPPRPRPRPLPPTMSVTGTGASSPWPCPARDPAPLLLPPHHRHQGGRHQGFPKTFDAGVGIYAVTAVLCVTGMAWTAKKRH